MGFLLELSRLAKPHKAGWKVDFPDRSSVLGRSGDLSESEISTILKKGKP
jgi:hypothetical protein